MTANLFHLQLSQKETAEVLLAGKKCPASPGMHAIKNTERQEEEEIF